jgi:hypothetical protein
MSERGIVRNRAIVCVFDLNREDWRQVDHEYMLEKKMGVGEIWIYV